MKDDSTHIPEIEIVKSAQNGSQEAFTILYEKYYQYVSYVVYKVVQSSNDVEDIVQDIWTDVYHQIHQFKGESLFVTWLTRIALSKAKSHIRYLIKQKQTLCLDPSMHKTEITPEEIFSNCQEQYLLHTLIEDLPEHLSSVAKLRLECLTVRQIAEKLKISVVAAQTRNFRLKPALTKKWSSRQTEYEKDLQESP